MLKLAGFNSWGDSVKNSFVLVGLISLVFLFSGCGTSQGGERRQESDVDIEMSRQAPKIQQNVSPGEPQQGFKQEPTGTKNS